MKKVNCDTKILPALTHCINIVKYKFIKTIIFISMQMVMAGFDWQLHYMLTKISLKLES